MTEPTVDLEFVLHGDPTLDQVREFWKKGEFDEEHYLVEAIRRHLLTEVQREEMHDRRVSIEDLLNGRVTGNHSLWVAIVFAAWNEKLGFMAFGEGVRPAPVEPETIFLVKAVWKDKFVGDLTARKAAATLAADAGWLTDAVRQANPRELEAAAFWGSTGVNAIKESAVSVTGTGEIHLVVTLEDNPIPSLPPVFVFYAPGRFQDKVAEVLARWFEVPEPAAAEPAEEQQPAVEVEGA